jgi:hypothetical protein
MLVLNPKAVRFAAATWEGVRAIAIDRLPRREALEWSDFGPHIVFADVPRSRVRVRLFLDGPDLFDDPVRPGDEGILSFVLAPGAVAARNRRVSITCVAVRVAHDLRAGRWTRRIEFVALSPDGAADPVRIEPLGSLP